MLIRHILTVLLVVQGIQLCAQSEDYHLYLGFEPRFGKESWYEEDEWNVNLAPFVFEYALSNHVGLRAKSSVFMNVGSSEGNRLSLTGMGLGSFYYWKTRSSEHQYSGIFAGPWLEMAYDHIEKMQHTTIAAEAGYSFVLGRRWTINLSMQLGYSDFSSEEREGENHFGVLFNIGYWVF